MTEDRNAAIDSSGDLYEIKCLHEQIEALLARLVTARERIEELEAENEGLNLKVEAYKRYRSENRRLRGALESMPCDCTPPQFICSRCAAMEGNDDD